MGASAKGGLNPTAETTLFEQAQAGCRQSVNLLMFQHDGLVHAVVRQQFLGNLPYEEALQAGRTGLWRAIKGYDHQGTITHDLCVYQPATGAATIAFG